jgi:hypothetical protein
MQDADTSISQRGPTACRCLHAVVPEFALRYALVGTTREVSRLSMTFRSVNPWEIAAGLVVLAALTALVLWLVFRKRPTPEELERARRELLVQTGRIVDGMLLDVCEIEAEDGRTLTMLLFSYRNGGVDYECSQDITDMPGVVDVSQVRAGFPCSVRYQPGNPQNSIVVDEQWSGLRIGLPQFPAFDDPDPIDLSHLRPGRG